MEKNSIKKNLQNPNRVITQVEHCFQKKGLVGKECPKDAPVAKQKRNELRKRQRVEREKQTKLRKCLKKNQNRKEIK